MDKFLSKLTKKNWIFACSIAAVSYLLLVGSVYIEAHGSSRAIAYAFHHSFRDNNSDYSFFDMLPLFRDINSFGFDWLKMIFITFIFVAIPYLLISIYFFDYRNESNEGWKRVYLTVQILIPVFIIILLFDGRVNFLSILNWLIIPLGISEIGVLALIKSFSWFKAGFTRKQA